MIESLIDRIHECAFAPEHWPGVIDDLAEIAGARGGLLFAANGDILNWTSNKSSRPAFERFVGSGLFTRSSRAGRAIAARHAGFLRELDVYKEEELEADPLYPEYLWPNGLGWCAATAIPAPTGDVIFLTLEREKLYGPVPFSAIRQLDALRPHLARSALMSARLQLERARVASDTLALIGLPALILDASGKVLSANPLIEAMGDHIRWRSQDRITLKDASADAQLCKAVDTLGMANDAPPRSFAVRSRDTQAGAVVHLIPIRRSARDIFTRSAAVLAITPVTLPQAPSVELVQSLFDLTPAEARVARNLTAGQTVEEIAASGGVSANTVRTHVRGVLEKTGSRRQADVIALFGGIATLGGR